ncbi:hypothetical protein [Paenibacillus rubinfantis]|uniref:hypothetical protein n=1 Tax=Paenibacillus rubinfantis TaxID=1720296 RepID=UPI00073E7705|nr:hypothetical protein [Paenibacillus rubinfantis]
MNTRFWMTAVWLFIGVTLLSGCVGRPQTKTIIIPDTEESQDANGPSGPFEVEKIYRIPLAAKGGLLGWFESDSLLANFSGPNGSESLQVIKPPYEELQQVLNTKAKQFVFNLSPDGQRVAALEEKAGQYELQLLSLTGGTDQKLITFDTSQLTTKWFTWSDNSRYLSFANFTSEPRTKGESEIRVYDTQNGTSVIYKIPIPKDQRAELYSSVHITDDGNNGFLLVQRLDETRLVIGKLKEGEFVAQYEHELAQNGQAAWLNNDQVAFLAHDGTLYTYDLRNEAVAVLLDNAFSFELSGDRQTIAYSKGDGTLLAGRVQGNNVLNARPIYQGVFPSQMSWSRDNRRLLIFGGRSLFRGTPAPSVGQSAETAVQETEWLPFIIEMK